VWCIVEGCRLFWRSGLHQSHVGWKVFQLAIWLGFIVAGIHYEWEGGLAIGVMGGMLAWYATGIVNGLWLACRRLLGLPVPPQPLHNVGQLDGWAAEVGLIDRPGLAGSSKSGRRQPGQPFPEERQ